MSPLAWYQQAVCSHAGVRSGSQAVPGSPACLCLSVLQSFVARTSLQGPAGEASRGQRVFPACWAWARRVCMLLQLVCTGRQSVCQEIPHLLDELSRGSVHISCPESIRRSSVRNGRIHTPTCRGVRGLAWGPWDTGQGGEELVLGAGRGRSRLCWGGMARLRLAGPEGRRSSRVWSLDGSVQLTRRYLEAHSSVCMCGKMFKMTWICFPPRGELTSPTPGTVMPLGSWRLLGLTLGLDSCL